MNAGKEFKGLSFHHIQRDVEEKSRMGYKVNGGRLVYNYLRDVLRSFCVMVALVEVENHGLGVNGLCNVLTISRAPDGSLAEIIER